MKKELPKSYRGALDIWKRYWAAYGGLRTIVRSPYFLAAFLMWMVTLPFWLTAGWWELAIQVLPNLLGFSFGGTAIFLGLIEPRLVKHLSFESASAADSDLAVIVASFVHFVVVQGLALLAACLCKAFFVPVDELPQSWFLALTHIPPGTWCLMTAIIGWLPGSFVFVYALTLVLATSLEVFRVSQMIETMTRHELENSERSHSSK